MATAHMKQSNTFLSKLAKRYCNPSVLQEALNVLCDENPSEDELAGANAVLFMCEMDLKKRMITNAG
jgi:hypothetical protein